MLAPDPAMQHARSLSLRGVAHTRQAVMQSESIDDPYAVLGVSRTVTADDLKRAYRKLSMAWHPDRHAGASEARQQEAAHRFKLINAAYVAIGEILRSEVAAEASGQAAVVQQSDVRVE